jgi:MFS transporter, DHA1 family, inner membrane transport protein
VSGIPGVEAAPAGAPARPWTAPAVMLAFATAVVVTTEFIVVGLLPEMARDLDISLAEAGGFVSWFALSSAILGPLLTIVASRMAPHRVLAVVLLAFALGNLAATLVPSYPVVVAVRIIQGAALPVLVSIGSAAVAQLAGPGREGWAVALVYIGVAVAIMLAVPAGVLLAEYGGWPMSFASLAILAAMATAILGTAFPRLETSGLASMNAQAMIIRRPAVQIHLLLSAMFAAYSYLAAFLDTITGFDSRRIAGALMGFGIAGLLGNWIAGRVADRGATAATAKVAFVLMLAMAALSLLGGTLILLLPLLAVWGAAHAAASLLCQVRVMLVAPSAPAFASSLNISAGNVGIAAGAVVGGWIVDHYGIGAVGFGGAALAACALAIAVAVQRARR